MKPKVLFIMHMPPPVHGAAMMGKYIHDSKLVNSEFECYYVNLTTAKSLEDVGKGSLRKFIDIVKLIHKVRKTICEIRPDIVYTTPNAKDGPFYKDFIIMSIIKAAIPKNSKIVAHYHNKGVATRHNRLFDNLLYKSFFKGLKVILLSMCLYSDIQKYVKEENVLICPNGIPPVDIQSKETLYEQLVPKSAHILFLSNLLIEKGVLVLLDALEILKNKKYLFVCDFVGGETKDIDESRFAQETEKRGLNKIAIYHGKKYGIDKERFWKEDDIFVFPTFYNNECFPLVLLEAMQHGLVCISTSEAAIPEIVDDNKTGIIINRDTNGIPSAIELASAIEKMIENPQLCYQMGQNGLKKYQKEYTIEIFESNLVEALKLVMRTKVPAI